MLIQGRMNGRQSHLQWSNDPHRTLSAKHGSKDIQTQQGRRYNRFDSQPNRCRASIVTLEHLGTCIRILLGRVSMMRRLAILEQSNCHGNARMILCNHAQHRSCRTLGSQLRFCQHQRQAHSERRTIRNERPKKHRPKFRLWQTSTARQLADWMGLQLPIQQF